MTILTASAETPAPPSPAPEAPAAAAPQAPPAPDLKTETVKVDWEFVESGLKSNKSRSDLGGWRFSRGAAVKNEGKAGIVEGKGKANGKALALEPDGENGVVCYAIVTLPSAPVQDLRFSIRREGSDPVSAGLFIRLPSRKDFLRVAIEKDLVSLRGGSQRAEIRGAPDLEGWLNLELKLDRAAKTATLRLGGEEKGIVLEAWEDEPLTCQFNANFKKLVGRAPILIDQVSWVKPAN